MCWMKWMGTYWRGPEKERKCFSLHIKACALLFSSKGPLLPPQTLLCITASWRTLYVRHLVRLRNWNVEICPPEHNLHDAVYLWFMLGSTWTCARTHAHTQKLALPLLWEAVWACRIKTYHQLSFSPHRPGDFMWGFTNLVCYLFISSVIKDLGSVMPLVRTTMLWNPLIDGF